MDQLNSDELINIIIARLRRTQIYLQYFLKDLPTYLIQLRHKLEHPLSELHILLQHLSPHLKLEKFPSFVPTYGLRPDDISYLELALNELETALSYLLQSNKTDLFEKLDDLHLEQRLKTIIQQLEKIKDNFSRI